jgi:soluble lytic murein transglycosylase
MRRLCISISAAVIAVLLASSAVLADFYKYVDKDGVMHITNVPVSSRFTWVMREKGGASAGGGVVSFDEMIYVISQRNGVDPSLVKAIVKAESDFDSYAVSRAGAKGLMQLMPETARLLGVKDVYDPEENVDGGTRYLSRLMNVFNGKLPMAIAAYNAGETAVLKYGAIPPYSETQQYVKKVLYYYDYYSGKGW